MGEQYESLEAHLIILRSIEKAVEKCKKGKLKFIHIHYSVESEEDDDVTMYTYMGGARDGDKSEIKKNLLILKFLIDKSIDDERKGLKGEKQTRSKRAGTIF